MLRISHHAAVFACAIVALVALGLAVNLDPGPCSFPCPAPCSKPVQPYWPDYIAAGESSWVDGRTWQGEELAADFPPQDWFPNIGSKRDGAGMCVMSSIEMAARWSGLDQYRGLRDWCAQEAGGGYPQKVDRQLAAFAKAKGFEAVPYLQYEGKDVGQVLEQIDRQGLMAACTYGYSPRYHGTIAHMVCCPKFSGKWGVILDNNAIGGVKPPDSLFEWMSKEELVKRVNYPSGSGWVFAWLAPPPPPLPRN